MPKQVFIESRNKTLEFPDEATQDQINDAVTAMFPPTGEDMAKYVEDLKNATIEGGELVNPFIPNAPKSLSRDNYVLLKQHQADKKTSFGDALGIAKDTFTNIIDEVGTGIGATAYNLSQGEIGNVAESAGAGMVAGTIGLTDIASKIFNPAKPIPRKEDFVGKRITRLVDNPNFPNAYPMEVEDVNTEEDYNKLIDSEMQRDADLVNNLYAMELTMRGAPIEEVSRGFQYVDPTLLAGAASTALKTGASLFSKMGAKSALGTAGTVGASTAPSALGRAGLSAVEGTAGAVQGVASLPSRALQGVGQIAESVAPGSGVGAQATALTASAMGDLGLTAGVVGGAKATEKVAEVVGAAANAARQEASRAGLLEQVALNSAVSPAGRKLAAGLAQLQPVGRAALDLTKGAVKGAAAGSVVGGVLGGLAERNLEGVAAGFGAGGALGGLTGSLHSAFDLGREALGGSTSRTRQQATGDLNTFLAERPEVERSAWSQTLNRLVERVGSERAAAQIDALKIAEANGAKVRVATPDEMKQWQNPGWVDTENAFDLVLNPERISGDTAAHETSHVLFSSVINRAFKPEIEQAVFGLADPITGEIVRPGLFDDISLAKVADQIGDAYGDNTKAANRFKGYANVLRNATDVTSLQKARTSIADEMSASYVGNLFGRLRSGRFNPDRLPLVYRKVLSAIEDGVLDKFRSAIFEKGMDLGFDNVAKTFKDKNGKPIRIPELDAIVKKAFAQKLKTVDVANAKPDLIPVKPADRILWAKTYGGAKGVLNDDGTPKSQAQIDAEATARWQDMTMRLSALPDNEKIGIDFARDKAGKTVMTAKGQLSPTAINAILDSGALDPSAKAVLVEVLNSMQRADKSTFDTRYYGVYTRGKGGNKMVAGVKSASQNEILPYSVEINSKDGVLIRAVDMSKVRDRLATAMNKPQFKDAYSNPVDALKDLRKYMDNLTQINAVDSAALLGGGVKGATKRNLFYEALGFRLRNGETLINAPDSVVNKSQNTIKSYRAERFAKLVDSGNRFAFEEATTYERGMKNFQPDAFTPESLPNGEAYTNPDGYRILNKAGSKLFRTYDDTGKLIGIAESKEKAMKKAQDEFAKKAMKEEPANIRFQFAGEAAEMPKFMRDSLETAKAMAKEGKDSETIRAITGWFPGKYDDKMRWEVPDQMSVLKGTVKADELVSRAWKSVTQPRQPDAPTAQLQDILRHPSLFSAYPEAATIPIVADVNLSSSGAIGPMSGFEGNVIQVNGNLSGDRLRSTLLHEIQHWIQQKEGFAKGGNPNFGGAFEDSISQALRQSDSESLRDALSEYEQSQISKNVDKFLSILSKSKDKARTFGEQNKDVQMFLSARRKLANEIQKAGVTSMDSYRRLAGEIESRDVQARQSFTPEQRKAIAPYSSENIAKEEAIVLKSASKSPTEMRFQPDENLVTVHNLTEPNLKHALKVGGLAVPSLAVVRTDLSNFDSFGDITLLAKPNLIDPQINKASKVFNADVYSPRYPTVKTVFKRSELDKVESIFKSYSDELKQLPKKGFYDSLSSKELVRTLEDEGFNRLQSNHLAQYAYLRDAGLIDPPKEAIDSYKFGDLLRNKTNELRDEVVNFVQSKVDNAGVKYEEKIPDGYTNSGTRRFLPHDLDTVVKIMTRKLKDGEGFNYGVPSIRAANAKPFKTLKAIKNDRDKIITSEKMEALKKEVDQEFMTLAESALNARKSKPSFGGLDAVSDDMKALVQGDNSWIREMYGDSPVVQDMKTFVAKLRDMPTEYFEAKVKRAVQLQEFEAAVVPMNTPEDVKAALRRKGLAVREYDPNNKDSRKAVIQSVSSEFNIRFQPDPTSPNILNGSNGSRIIKSNSGKYRVYLATGALAGVKDTLESAQKLVQAKSNK